MPTNLPLPGRIRLSNGKTRTLCRDPDGRWGVLSSAHSFCSPLALTLPQALGVRPD